MSELCYPPEVFGQSSLNPANLSEDWKKIPPSTDWSLIAKLQPRKIEFY